MTQPQRFLSMVELADRIRKGALSPVDLVDEYLEAIEKLDPVLNSFITVAAEEARRDAERVEAELKSGKPRGPLHGIPISVKDMYDVAGYPTTCASKILSENTAASDAEVVSLLRSAGSIILGKNNMQEFALGPTSSDSYYGPVKNPWNTDRIPGGSSGGSAAAVAAGLCAGSLGTDSGGSIRLPASLCGVVGLKPTFGLVSLKGVFPLSHTLDHAGPITRWVEDAALMLDVLTGSRLGLLGSLQKGVKGLKLGILGGFFFEEARPEVADAVRKAIDEFGRMGVETVPLEMPYLQHVRSITSAILSVEGAELHEHFLDSRLSDYAGEVRSRLLLGRLLTGPEYARALRLKEEVRERMLKDMKNVDAVALPTTSVTAPKIGEDLVKIGERMENVKAILRFTSPFNIAGSPSVSIPCGFSSEGLPIGLMISGRPFGEEAVLRLAYAYQQTRQPRFPQL